MMKSSNQAHQLYFKTRKNPRGVNFSLASWEMIANMIEIQANAAPFEAILTERKNHWKPKPSKYPGGVLRLSSDLAASPMKGVYPDG